MREKRRPPTRLAVGQVVGRKACPTVLDQVKAKRGAKLRSRASTGADPAFRLLTMEVLYQLS